MIALIVPPPRCEREETAERYPNSGVMYQSFSRRRPRVTVFVTSR